MLIPGGLYTYLLVHREYSNDGSFESIHCRVVVFMLRSNQKFRRPTPILSTLVQVNKKETRILRAMARDPLF